MYEQCSPGVWVAPSCYHLEDVGVTCTGGYRFKTWQSDQGTKFEISHEISQEKRHSIERLEIRDNSIVKVSARARVSRLSLSGDASLHISDELTITDHMVWRQGSISGVSEPVSNLHLKNSPGSGLANCRCVLHQSDKQGQNAPTGYIG